MNNLDQTDVLGDRRCDEHKKKVSFNSSLSLKVSPGISLATTEGALGRLHAICWWLIIWQHWGTALLTM